MSIDFIHLCVHSEFSLIDGLCRHKALMKQLEKLHYPSIAITDKCNLFGMIRYYKQALANRVKPIIGTEVDILHPDSDDPDTVLLLCQTNTGYRHLTELISKGYLEGIRQDVPLLNAQWLTAEAVDGLIMIAKGHKSNIGRALLSGDTDSAATHFPIGSTFS